MVYSLYYFLDNQGIELRFPVEVAVFLFFSIYTH
jgi:hypothetical protein